MSKFGDMTIGDCLQRLESRRAAPTIRRLDSGYWHVRWNSEQWVQWPCCRAATLADAFGFVDQRMIDAANALAENGQRRSSK